MKHRESRNRPIQTQQSLFDKGTKVIMKEEKQLCCDCTSLQGRLALGLKPKNECKVDYSSKRWTR